MARDVDDDLSPLFRDAVATMDRTTWGQIVQRTQRRTPETPEDVRALIHRVGPEEGADPYLMEAMVRLESGGNPLAQSRKGAQGLGQLMPATAKRFGVQNPFDPEQNLRGSAKFLAHLKDLFPGRVDLQLAAYHAGEGAVQRAGNRIPDTSDGNMTTGEYVTTILGKYRPGGGKSYTSRAAGAGVPSPIEGVSALQSVPPPATGHSPGFAAAQALQARVPFQAHTPPPMIDPADVQVTAPGVLVDPTTQAGRQTQPPPTLPQADLTRGTTFAEPQPGALQAGPIDLTRGQPPAPVPFQGAVRFGEGELPPTVPPSDPQILGPGSRNIPPFGSRGIPKGDALEEAAPGRYLGGIVQGAVGMVRSAVAFVPAVEEALGLHGETLNLSLGTEGLTPLLTQLEQLVKPQTGDSGPGFLDKLASGIGTSLMSLVPAAGVGRFLQGLATVAPRVANVGAALTGGVLEAASEGGQLYEQLVPLVGPDEAASRAMQSFALNTVLVTATDKLGIFGEASTLLRKTLSSVSTNAVQEVVQYDIERRQLTVPGDHPGAEGLLRQGWVREGSQIVKPFVIHDAAEAMLIGAVIGGIGGAVLHAVEMQPGPAQEAVREDAVAVAPQIPGTLVKDAEGLPLRVYHGTRQAFDQFDPARVGEREAAPLLYGPGFYFTEDPAIASGYSKTATAQEKAAPPEPTPHGIPAGGDFLSAMLDSTPQPAVVRDPFPTQANVRPAYLNIATPFDASPSARYDRAELVRILGTVNPEAAQQVAALRYTHFDGELAFNVLMKISSETQGFGRWQDGTAQVNAALRQAGYDGITHIGGDEGTAHRVWIAFSPGQVIPAFGIDAALQAQGQAQDDQPPPGLDPTLWQRWTGFLDRLLPPSSGGVSFLRNQRGGIGRSPLEIRADLRALDAGGEMTQAVLDRLGVASIGEASQALMEEGRAASQAEEQTATAPAGTITPEASGDPALPVSPAPPGPPLRAGAEGLTPERYRTASGGWRIPLKDLPSQELELQDLLRQQGGIRLIDEELQGELAAVITRKETGLSGLQNNTSGLRLQQMAEIAQEHGFLATADKEALLQALDRSVTQGLPVYSVQATGRINLLDDPHVQAAYQAVLDAVDAMGPATETQVAGVRHRVDVHDEARALIDSGQFTLDDVRELFPNQTLNDTMASALLQSIYTVGQEVGKAAQAYLDSGGRVGSREEASLQETMALLAELDPYRLGVSAAQSRGLGILNDPLSGYTQYLNRLHQALTDAPERSMRQIAVKIAGAHQQAEAAKVVKDQAYWQAHPEELAQLFAELREWTAPRTDLQEQLPLLPEAQPELLSALDILPDRAEAARLAEDLNGLLRDWTVAREAGNAAEAARRGAQWRAAMRTMQATIAAARAEQAGLADVPEGPYSLLETPTPLTLTADPQEGELLSPARSPEEQALIDAAYTSERAALTPAEYAAQDRDQRYAEAQRQRRDLDIQWRLDLRDFRRMEEARQAGHTRWEPGPMDAAALQRLDQALHPWLQQSQQLPMTKVLAQTAQPRFRDYFLEIWYNAMLSNPATHIANLLSNASVVAWAIPERYLAGNYAAAAEQSGRALHTGVEPGEATAMLYGLVHGIQGAWAVAARSFKHGIPSSGLSKEELRAPVFTAQHLGFDPASPFGRTLDLWFNYIGLPWTVPSGGRLPSRALMTADEFFKSLGYSMELNALAYREAVSLGYEGRAFAEHVHRVVTAPTLGHLQEAAGTFAVIQTFQQALEPASLGGHIQALANYSFGGEDGQAVPAGRLLIPFVQTPANIARYALERTPLGFAFKSVRDDLAAGGARADLAHAKMGLGTLALVGLAGFAMAGRLVGRAPDDPEIRQLWLKQHPEYSIQLPSGLWVSLERLDPLGMLAGMVGDAVQIAGAGDRPAWERGVAMLYYPFLKNIASKTYMRSLSDFFDVMSSRAPGRDEVDGTMAQAFRFLTQQGASKLQPSALLAATARLLDPAEVETREMWAAIYARVPGWRRQVPNRRTLGGEKALYGLGVGEDMLANTVRAYWPLRMARDQTSPADREILANHMQISRPPRALASYGLRPGEQAQSHSHVDTQTLPRLTMTAAQYERYAVFAGGNQQEARGIGLTIPDKALSDLVDSLSKGLGKAPPQAVMGLSDYLDYLVTTPEYQQETPGPGGGKEDLIREAVLEYREMGRDLLLEDDDVLRQQYEETHITRESLKVPLGQREADQLKQRAGYVKERTLRRKALGLPPAEQPVPQGLGVGR